MLSRNNRLIINILPLIQHENMTLDYQLKNTREKYPFVDMTMALTYRSPQVLY